MPTSRVAPLLTNMEEAVESLEDKQFEYFSDAVFIPKDDNTLSVEDIKRFETAVGRGKVVEVVSIVKEIIQNISKTTIKIAVTGDSGNGMSSFINALRLIGHEEEDSAPTGVVRTTKKPACYFSSRFPNVELWDLPGLGATAQSVESYLEEMQISTYDLIIIIASEQFSSNHVKLAKAMQGMRRRFYVVWTKLDRDLSTSASPEPQLLQSIQTNIRENLQQEKVKEPPMFLVSAFKPDLHDFPRLGETLQKDLPVIKYHGLFKTLYQIGEKAVNETVEFIKKRIDGDDLQRGLETLDPDNQTERREFNPDNLIEVRKAFQELFGVDDKSLYQVALKMENTHFKTSMESQETQSGWTLAWMYHSGRAFVSTGFDYVQCCFFSHHYRHTQQKRILDETAGKAKEVLSDILRDSIPYP
ncbi:immunity-related GTPase family M protein 1-like isoform X3 [Mus pahari]|uniref:immunity-related GTPase family M protein 1-like isoform X3 n=1 Tax=Mus pahari TaxID=10093 RepID=UPI000A306013|nr:immunity-related GTPase family M protein 1-like isoform X3 [Mus pahari]